MTIASTSSSASRFQAGPLWEEFQRQRTQQIRSALIGVYAPLVKFVVDRLRIALPPGLDRDDLLGYGTIGLIEAVDRFEPERGFKFETFAVPRIRGAVIDALRTLDLVPRSVRERARAIEHAYREHFTLHGEMPDDDVVAARLGMTVAQFQQTVQDAACTVLPLSSPTTDSEFTLEERIPDLATTEPLDAAMRTDVVARLAQAIAALPDRERLIVTLYYYEELTLREISEVLGITESRVSQLMSRARLQLRAMLDELRVGPLDLT